VFGSAADQFLSEYSGKRRGVTLLVGRAALINVWLESIVQIIVQILVFPSFEQPGLGLISSTRSRTPHRLSVYVSVLLRTCRLANGGAHR